MSIAPKIKFNLPSPVLRKWREQNVKLLVLAAKRKAGKDVFLDYVLRHYPGIRHYRIAEAPVRIAEILELPLDRKIQQTLFGVNKLLYPLLHESAYKRRVAKLLDKERPSLAVVEAIRTREEYEEFVVKRGGILVGITADNRMRYERARADAQKNKEKRDEGNMTFRRFMDREKVEVEREIAWIVSKSHFIMDNSQNEKAPFYRRIDEIMSKLGFTPHKKYQQKKKIM